MGTAEDEGDFEEEAEKFLSQVKNDMATEMPTFNEIVHLLLPRNSHHASTLVTLEIQDNYGQRRGAYSLPLEQILQSKGGEVDGPFRMTLNEQAAKRCANCRSCFSKRWPSGSSIVSESGDPDDGITLKASLRARWVRPSQAVNMSKNVDL